MPNDDPCNSNDNLPLDFGQEGSNANAPSYFHPCESESSPVIGEADKSSENNTDGSQQEEDPNTPGDEGGSLVGGGETQASQGGNTSYDGSETAETEGGIESSTETEPAVPGVVGEAAEDVDGNNVSEDAESQPNTEGTNEPVGSDTGANLEVEDGSVVSQPNTEETNELVGSDTDANMESEGGNGSDNKGDLSLVEGKEGQASEDETKSRESADVNNEDGNGTPLVTLPITTDLAVGETEAAEGLDDSSAVEEISEINSADGKVSDSDAKENATKPAPKKDDDSAKELYTCNFDTVDPSPDAIKVDLVYDYELHYAIEEDRNELQMLSNLEDHMLKDLADKMGLLTCQSRRATKNRRTLRRQLRWLQNENGSILALGSKPKDESAATMYECEIEVELGEAVTCIPIRGYMTVWLKPEASALENEQEILSLIANGMTNDRYVSAEVKKLSYIGRRDLTILDGSNRVVSKSEKQLRGIETSKVPVLAIGVTVFFAAFSIIMLIIFALRLKSKRSFEEKDDQPELRAAEAGRSGSHDVEMLQALR